MKQEFSDPSVPYYDALLRFAIRKTGNSNDAQEIVQETFLRYRQSDKSLEGDYLRNYLFVIVRNLICDRQKRMGPEIKAKNEYATIYTQSEAENPSAIAENRDFLSAAREFVAGLPDRDQKVFRLKFLENWESPEIAAMVETSPGNVRKILCEIMRKLRKRFVES